MFRLLFVNRCGSLFFFFFQAEDGIRDLTVTGVQTCALPISGHPSAVVTSSGATGAMNQAGTGTPAARNKRLDRSLSIARALASAPLPVYGTPITSRIAWSVPPDRKSVV